MDKKFDIKNIVNKSSKIYVNKSSKKVKMIEYHETNKEKRIT